MILAANRCQDRSPTLYVAASIEEIEGILNPKLSDVAVLIEDGLFSIYQLTDDDLEPDGDEVLSSNACDHVWVLAGTATGGTGGAGLYSGIGSPEGVVAAAVGSIYTDLTDTGHPVMYVKTTGGATDIGWVLFIAT